MCDNGITQCTGAGCHYRIRSTCYRYLATPGFRQSYFAPRAGSNPPVLEPCEHYIRCGKREFKNFEAKGLTTEF